jgi:hypothetical protein
MDRRQIHFLRFLLEAYEGVAVLSTVDNATGLVSLLIAPGRETEATELVSALKDRMMLEPVLTDEHPTFNIQVSEDSDERVAADI